ncbi:hypothetical protein [Enterocloster clostridioformis]|uniref:hypothetical protein n=1 Tax=Enterocloster clostridioformis TaxID=1531 RepID=UPI0008E93149|nr:hypothetical protein [Enterocloster clostridioformis]SFG86811.1 hypothetical protein SAMN05660211_04195 [Enterocloster clostridioformis]
MFWFEDEEKTEEQEPPTSPAMKILLFGLSFLACCYMIRMGICYLSQIKVPLFIIGLITLIAVTAYLIWRHRRNNRW